MQDPKGYFLGVGFAFNLFDILQNLLIITSCIWVLSNEEFSQGFYLASGLAQLLVWLNLLQYLRMFKQVSAFVRMVIDMFFVIRYFMLVFVVGLIAFASCFLMLQRGDTSVEIIGESTLSNAFTYVFL